MASDDKDIANLAMLGKHNCSNCHCVAAENIELRRRITDMEENTRRAVAAVGTVSG